MFELRDKTAQVQLLGVLALVMQLPKAGQHRGLPTGGAGRLLCGAVCSCCWRSILLSETTPRQS